MKIPQELITALKNGNLEIIDSHLKNNIEICNIHDEDNFNMTLLHVAASSGNVESTKFLLSIPELDINAVQKLGRTALHMSAIKNNQRIMELLINNGINVMITDTADQKALDLTKNKIATEMLIRPTLDSDSFFIDQLYQLNYPYLRRKFLESENNKKIRSNDGNSLMHHAITIGNYELINFLIDNNCNITVPNKAGIAPIHQAITKGDINVIELLLNDSTVNQPDSQNLTPIHYFLANNDPNFFVEPKPPIYITEPEANNTQQSSFLFDFDDIEKLSEKPERKQTIKSQEIYGLLINNNADVKLVARGGITSLHFAVETGDCKIIKDLINRGVDINYQTKTTGTTALHLAYCYNNHAAVNILLENDAKTTITDHYGRTYNEL